VIRVITSYPDSYVEGPAIVTSRGSTYGLGVKTKDMEIRDRKTGKTYSVIKESGYIFCVESSGTQIIEDKAKFALSTAPLAYNSFVIVKKTSEGYRIREQNIFMEFNVIPEGLGNGIIPMTRDGLSEKRLWAFVDSDDDRFISSEDMNRFPLEKLRKLLLEKTIETFPNGGRGFVFGGPDKYYGSSFTSIDVMDQKSVLEDFAAFAKK